MELFFWRGGGRAVFWAEAEAGRSDVVIASFGET